MNNLSKLDFTGRYIYIRFYLKSRMCHLQKEDQRLWGKYTLPSTRY